MCVHYIAYPNNNIQNVNMQFTHLSVNVCQLFLLQSRQYMYVLNLKVVKMLNVVADDGVANPAALPL